VEKSVVHVAQTIGIVVVILNIKQAFQQFKICFITVNLPSVMAMWIRQTTLEKGGPCRLLKPEIRERRPRLLGDKDKGIEIV
jgi:hypothetical protein